MSRLETLRRDAGLNQSQLAERIGVSQGSLSGYENGRAVPVRLLPRIADALGCDLAALSPPVDDGKIRRRRKKTARARPSGGGPHLQTVAFFQAQARVTLEELAQRSGLPRAAVSGFVHGTIAVTWEDAKALAAVLKCKPEELTSPPATPHGSGSALMEAYDMQGFPVAGKKLSPEARAQALYEQGFGKRPPRGEPEKALKPAKYPEGREVECYRKILGMTQAELARLAGVTQQQISEVEAGNVPLPASVWSALATQFNVHPEGLGCGEWAATSVDTGEAVLPSSPCPDTLINRSPDTAPGYPQTTLEAIFGKRSCGLCAQHHPKRLRCHQPDP